MSENAILSIQAQGTRFFAPQTETEPLRWARFDLHDTFKKANRNPENVSRLLTVSIPANAQMMIAGVLEMPRRDLFTDLPPEQAKQTVDGMQPPQT
jgi:hypothetical protein